MNAVEGTTQETVQGTAQAAARPEVHVLGVRHHGPGSARSLLGALERLQPDAVLVEGPADADGLLEHLDTVGGPDGLVPPVALLAHVADDPSVAAFWPFAEFSPEWQALTWARRAGVVVRFCDLPAAVTLAARTGEEPERPGGPSGDPLAALAAAGGYDDPEDWWDAVVEGRRHAVAPFEELTAAMAALREAEGEPGPHEARREAHMRRTLRQVLADGATRVAVVVGAWHAPALAGRLPAAAGDNRLLTRLPKRKVQLTWVPWTHSRLAADSGYGAGITSPGWYTHLFASSEDSADSADSADGADSDGAGTDPLPGWFTAVARVLREQDLPVSTASVIEAVRSARSLAALRGRAAGLAEVQDVTRAVLCDGDDGLLALVTDALVVGERLGQVPDTVTTVPLEADLRLTARRLRLPFAAAEKALDLDLREPTGLARSRLLRRLQLLDVPWGVPAASQVRATGTFRESWTLRWQPELSVRLVEASLWGTTVPAAAAARVNDRVQAADTTLVQVADDLERCLLADLPDALPTVLRALDERAARSGDAGHLMAALPPVVRSLRYGDVRGGGGADLARVADALLVRVCAALPAAAHGLDDAAAALLRTRVEDVHRAVSLREDPAAREQWVTALQGLVDRGDVHGLVQGRVVRLLHDGGDLPGAAGVDAHVHRALSVGADAADRAAWVEGFVAGGGLLLVHDRQLLATLDAWLTGLAAQELTDSLPALRRAFGAIPAGERRQVGAAVTRLAAGGRRREPEGAAADRTEVDWQLVLPAARTVAAILVAGAR